MVENIGERIKELRVAKDLTLAEFGKIVNLSASYLSQIEHNKTSPSLTTLIDIARALDVEVRYFFETDSEAAYIKRAGRTAFEGNDMLPITKINLTPIVGNRMLVVSQMTLQPQTASGSLDLFLGEEFYFVLSGNLIIQVGDETIELTDHDSIHIDAYQQRSWNNPGQEPCVFIWGQIASLEKH